MQVAFYDTNVAGMFSQYECFANRFLVAWTQPFVIRYMVEWPDGERLQSERIMEFMASISLIQTAYDYIRQQIMLGEFMPGTLLSENELAETLNMSRTPVRAAIAQLEYEGLAVSLKNRGILVKELSMKEALDMIDIMYTFQLYALSHIESQGDRPDLKKLKEYLDLQLEATRQGAYHLYVDNTLRFTQCFISVTNNNTMLKIMEAHASKLVLYSTINYKITPHEPHFSGNRLNQSVYDALLAEDYNRIRAIFTEAHSYNRERMLRAGRI